MDEIEVKRMVDTLESLGKRLSAEVAKGDRVDWELVREYMERREETIRAIGGLERLPSDEQERIARLVEEDRKTIRSMEEMKDKVAAQMRRMGNEDAGKVLDMRG